VIVFHPASFNQWCTA